VLYFSPTHIRVRKGGESSQKERKRKINLKKKLRVILLLLLLFFSFSLAAVQELDEPKTKLFVLFFSRSLAQSVVAFYSHEEVPVLSVRFAFHHSTKSGVIFWGSAIFFFPFSGVNLSPGR